MKNNKQLQKKAVKNEVKVTDLGKVSLLTLGRCTNSSWECPRMTGPRF
ncbi:MAG: hypothetical protein US13_C0014G0013 [candidate division TM6 bacterium GW2011_GWE2_36_25]|nr:MAG: hypothetical protein US03_C0013G0013 [candidate division TM6 bacterium GW2011_GWF2_36_131]KKQ02556.1 MAG: hypothetical protein US13_C0014G0013 [candidate division TM6 bacterium GW2011_GWE2_36_25]KKQ19311.1 MAG: hypothetical protein US32_C0011G0013 [candidate division TM6 bacterium GW2011_GWA2_36_9]